MAEEDLFEDSTGNSESINMDNEDARLFSTYGEFIVVLDAPIHVMREILVDCSNEQIRGIISILEDQMNETPLKGNEELFKRHLLVWMLAIRQLDGCEANMVDCDNFKLNFREWEAQQFQ